MKRLGPILALVLAACSGTPVAPQEVATPFVPPPPVVTLPPVVGTGLITFGGAKALDEETLKVNPSKDSFAASVKNISWSASLSEAAGSTTLTLILAKKGSGGSESIRYTEELMISNPTFGIVANTSDLAALVDRKPGTYVMRILRDATTLAEGEFRLTK